MRAYVVVLAAMVFFAVAISFVILSSMPPIEWQNADYSNATIQELRDEFTGISEEDSFKSGYGWVDRHNLIENQLRVLLGQNPNSTKDDTAIIALVHLDRWVDLLIIGRYRFHSKVLFERTELNIVGGI